MTDKSKKTTLTDGDIKSGRGSNMGRRAFILGTVGGTTALAGCVGTGITDADLGAYADPVGNGRGTTTRVVAVRRSCTDSDVGPLYVDPIGRGRRC